MAEPFTPEQAITQKNLWDKPPVKSGILERRKFGGLMDRLVDVNLRDVNARDPEYGQDKELIRRQRRILHQLSPNIIEELHGHLQAAHNEQWHEFNEKLMLKGEVFERLLEAEDQLYDLFPETIRPEEETEDKQRIGETILGLMQNPGRFGFDDMDSLSNPDLFSIRFEGDSYIIETSIEAKTHLDGRTRHQLSDMGFRRAINIILDKINSLEDSSKHGLDGLGIGGHAIRLSDKYKQSITVPRNTQITPNSIGRSFGTKYAMNNEQTDRFSRDLQEMESQGLLKKACFSNEDIGAITDFFLDEINKLVEAQK